MSSSVRYEGWLFAGSLVQFVFTVPALRWTDAYPRVYRLAAILALIFPMYWLTLQFVQAQHPLEFIAAPMINYAAAYGYSFDMLLNHSVVHQFLKQNLQSWNLFGVVMLGVVVWKNGTVRRWLIVPAAAFAAMTILSLTGRALPNHTFWRIAAVWSVLVVLFTACWIVRQGELLSSRCAWRYAMQFVVLVMLLWQFFLQAERLTAYTDDKVLIETSNWQYLHVVVASQHPEAFVYNTGPNLNHPSMPMIDLVRTLDRSELQAEGIRYLLFKSAKMKSHLDNSSSVHRVREFGRWVVYELGRATQQSLTRLREKCHKSFRAVRTQSPPLRVVDHPSPFSTRQKRGGQERGDESVTWRRLISPKLLYRVEDRGITCIAEQKPRLNC